MKFISVPNQSRIHKQDAWKKSAYAFVPFQTNFGELCGFADDIVAAGQGFPMHPHRNMEITTIMLQGTQMHRDNTGGESLIDENCVQTMSAGAGIMHSEFNGSKTDAFHSFQIWVYPNVQDIAPRYEQFKYAQKDTHNRIVLALSPDRRDGSALINQNAFFSLSKLDHQQSITYLLHQKGNGVYIHCATGKVRIDSQLLSAGDAIGLYEFDSVDITAEENADLIFVEVPMERGIYRQ